MFNSVTGEVTAKNADAVFLATGGLEWEICTSSRSLALLPPVGSRATLYTHLYHREDSLRLYGFSTAEERDLFVELLRVEGVGPRIALRILGGTDPARFAEAVNTGDLGSLVLIPGVGEKMAQRILLRLRGRLAQVGAAGEHEDILHALAAMGFDRRDAREIVTRVAHELRDSDLQPEEVEREILTRSIKALGARK